MASTENELHGAGEGTSGLTGWLTRKQNPSVAGVRIRAYSVIRELCRQGHAAEWLDPEHLERYETVVVHKTYDAQTRRIAEQLKKSGIRVIYDLCDNHFYNPRNLPEWTEHARNLRQMVAIADTVVVPTTALAEVVAKECDLKIPPTIIPDALDDLRQAPTPFRKRLAQVLPTHLLLRRVRTSLARGRTPLLWFGNHGPAFAEGGMLDLLKIRAELESLDRRLPLHLTVLSNNESKFRQHFFDWSFPTIYAKWNAHTFAAIAGLHRIALIPIQDNPFTRVKSENRVVTSFAHGLAVIADPIPSYRAFSESLCFGNWAQSIERYVSDEALRRRHVETGRRRSLDLCGIEHVARRWLELIGP